MNSLIYIYIVYDYCKISNFILVNLRYTPVYYTGYNSIICMLDSYIILYSYIIVTLLLLYTLYIKFHYFLFTGSATQADNVPEYKENAPF